jgi:hypothetical protein
MAVYHSLVSRPLNNTHHCYNTLDIHNNHSLKKVKDPYGNILTFHNYKSFCKYYKLNVTLFKQLIEGQRSFYNKWVRYNDDLKNYKVEQTIKLINPDGFIVLSPNFKYLEKQFGIKKHHLQNLWLGSSHNYLGWRPYKKELEGVKVKESELNPTIYKFISPELNIHETLNLREFARQQKLESKNLDSVWREKRNSCGGWRKYKEGVVYEKLKNKEFKFIDTDGKVIISNKLSNLSKEKNIPIWTLRKILNGVKSKTGWRKFEEPLINTKT